MVAVLVAVLMRQLLAEQAQPVVTVVTVLPHQFLVLQ